MPSRPRPKSAPSPGRDRAGRRPRTGSTAARRTSKVAGSGTAAPRATQSTPPVVPTPTSPPSSTARFTGRAAILVLVVAVLAVSYASSARAWLQQRSDISALRTDIAQRKAAIATLEQSERRWHDPAYIEAQARLRFGWVMPGQIGYRVIDANGEVLSDGGSSLSRPAGSNAGSAPAWWESAWGSVVEAGKSPATHPPRTDRQPALWIGGKHDRRHASEGTEPRRDQPPGR
jgi:cell division protein FtsB